MTVIKIPEKEAKAVSFAKFRCLQNMSRRSPAYMRANAKRTMKHNVSIFVTPNNFAPRHGSSFEISILSIIVCSGEWPS